MAFVNIILMHEHSVFCIYISNCYMLNQFSRTTKNLRAHDEAGHRTLSETLLVFPASGSSDRTTCPLIHTALLYILY